MNSHSCYTDEIKYSQNRKNNQSAIAIMRNLQIIMVNELVTSMLRVCERYSEIPSMRQQNCSKSLKVTSLSQ